MKTAAPTYNRKRKESRTQANPFLKLDRRTRNALVILGIVNTAAKMGRGRHHKATYSRTFAGKLTQANIEVVLHLRQAARKVAAAFNAMEPRG